MSDRTPCAVPGCGRSTKDRYDEWVCAKHWPLVPRAWRRAYARAKAQSRRFGVWTPRADRLWRACKRAAGK